jgi:hypothetical protein
VNKNELRIWKYITYIYLAVTVLIFAVGFLLNLWSNNTFPQIAATFWVLGGILYDAFSLRLIALKYIGPGCLYYVAALVMGFIAALFIPRIMKKLNLGQGGSQQSQDSHPERQ